MPAIKLSPTALRFAGKSCSRLALSRPIERRAFSKSSRWQLHTKEMNEGLISSLKVNQNRLMSDLHHTCQWGTGQKWGSEPTETGMSRLSLSDSDKQVRDWFVETTQALGCQTTVDEMGNIFAVRPGLRDDGPPTFVGSHLDTQPTGGRYDGILGVTAGVEMLKVLADNWVETEYPVGVVNWTNEEGARFPISMLSSGVWAGEIPLSTAHSLPEVGPGSTTLSTALSQIGYLGATPCSHTASPLAAHFELHIEQGPHLISSGRKIGVVQGVQAYRWYTVTVTGQDCHTGTTSFEHRADALLTASKMIVHSHRLATAKGALASTGILRLEPGSTNTVPGRVKFSLDIRAPADETVEALEADVFADFAAIAAGKDVHGISEGCTPGRPCEVSFTMDSVSPAVTFHPDCIKAVREGAVSALGEGAEDLMLDMVSGAGHDSVYTSKRVPTSMIFVPCKDGISHNPREYTSPEDCAIGAQVLLQAVVRYDQMRAGR